MFARRSVFLVFFGAARFAAEGLRFGRPRARVAVLLRFAFHVCFSWPGPKRLSAGEAKSWSLSTLLCNAGTRRNLACLANPQGYLVPIVIEIHVRGVV